jgi:uncharacterized protein
MLSKCLASLLLLQSAIPVRADAPAAAPVDESIALSLEIVHLLKADQVALALQGQMRDMILEQFKSESRCAAARPVLDEFSDAVTDQLTNTMGGEKAAMQMASAYAETYSTEELRAIVAFYKSPVGKKMIERSPELAQKTMQIVRDLKKAMQPALAKLSAGYGRRIADAAGTCAVHTDAEPVSPEK